MTPRRRRTDVLPFRLSVLVFVLAISAAAGSIGTRLYDDDRTRARVAAVEARLTAEQDARERAACDGQVGGRRFLAAYFAAEAASSRRLAVAVRDTPGATDVARVLLTDARDADRARSRFAAPPPCAARYPDLVGDGP